MRLFFHELKGQQRLYWRSRELAFFTVLLPMILFVLLGSVYKGSRIEGFRGREYLLPGMLGYGVVSTSFAGLAIFLVIRRESGILKRVRATPLPPATYIAAVLTSILIVFAVQAALLIALGRFLFDVGLPDRLLSFVLALGLGAAVFAALGLALTVAIRSGEGSSAVVNAIYLPMAFISGSFFSGREFPDFLRAIAEVLPLTYFIRVLKEVMLQREELWDQPASLAVLGVWGAVGTFVAVRYFRWEPREN